MSNFPTVEAMCASLRETGMNALSERIVATARPTVLFLRRQEQDASLPPGCSKIGGLPDLPEDFDWPRRPAYADAEARVRRLRKGIAEAEDPRALIAGTLSPDMVEQMEQMAHAEGFYADSAFEDSRNAIRELLHQMREPSTQDDAHRAGRIAWMRACIDAVQAEFPLVFVAQLDLGALSAEPGFDPLLPRHGVLSIFADAIDDAGGSCGHRVCWHDADPDTLVPRQPPLRLREWFDTWDAYGLPCGEEDRWERLTMAERLYPHSGVSVPCHWQSVFSDHGADWQAVWDWFHQDNPYVLVPRPPQDDAAAVAYFGDKLGGWPEDIQHHVENEVADKGERIAAPGRTPWRQLFSYGGEYYAGTRRMPCASSGDGQHYLMIHETDLPAHRFGCVRDVYQCS